MRTKNCRALSRIWSCLCPWPLLLLRSLQAAWALWTGKIDMLIVSHEAEDAVEDAAEKLKDV